MSFSSTGKAAHRITHPSWAVSLTKTCILSKRLYASTTVNVSLTTTTTLIVIFSFVILFFRPFNYGKQVPPFVVVVSGTSLFYIASIFYKLSILNNHAVLATKGWMNVIFTTVFLAHLILSALFLLQLGSLTGWLDNADHAPCSCPQ
jgi:hypothetical protein